MTSHPATPNVGDLTPEQRRVYDAELNRAKREWPNLAAQESFRAGLRARVSNR